MDLILFRSINIFAGDYKWLDVAAVFLASRFEYAIWFLLFCLLFLDKKKYFKMFYLAIFSAILSRFIVAEIIYFLAPKARPFVALESVNQLVEHSATPAFPSGHASFYFALSAMIYFYNKKLGALFLASSSLIAIARVFVGLHWPSDILAGAIIGIFFSFIVFRVFKS